MATISRQKAMASARGGVVRPGSISLSFSEKRQAGNELFCDFVLVAGLKFNFR